MVELLAALYVNSEDHPPTPPVKQVSVHPPSASRIMLPDGRYMAYEEEGVSADKARFSLITPHAFLSSRLAGCFFLKVLTFCLLVLSFCVHCG